MTLSWYKLEEPVTGNPAEIIIAGKKICVSKFKDQWHACSSRCPHAGGSMAEGYIDALGNIVCPVHHYRFSTQNGRNTSGEGYFLKVYKVEKREDGWYIGL